ncbi:terpene synthase family protein [Nocardia sp. NBC_00508]|uniref:terpene synthase family protein n=1 Tax=Nocardia sp. NBC_00508 TaxID=2975992 RepID=UPI002E81C666|nr:terpene synthase family protein [Nocardia sp. NBC_00508]WUD65057.1 terpene synthase family protein [Nocardia sp. NBC_00508]
MVSEYTSALERDIVKMRGQHEELLRAERKWSLRAMFSTPDWDIVDYCQGFRPNRFGAQACAEVERFCRAQQIWLEPGGEHYNSMTPYLHPGAISAERMTIIGLYNAILFWLNDTVGREKFGHLDDDEQRQARVAVDRLCSLLRTRPASGDANPVEASTSAFLAMLSALADPAWLDRFIEATIDHLRPAIRDQNARARGGLLSVTEYIDLRAQVSGMYPAIALCEFGRDDYLPWGRIRRAGLAGDLRRLRRLTVEIGALMNDVFSFEKECIVDLADFNLISAVLLNNPGWSLEDAVHGAGEIVRARLTEFRQVGAVTAEQCDRVGASDAALAATVSTHIADLVACVQATWAWQIKTLRYKGASIFTENGTG